MTTPTNIWPADLSDLSKEGTRHHAASEPQLPAIAEQITDDHDVVIQFSHEDGWYTKVNVYHRLSPTMWLALDVEDGAGDRKYETEALPVLMFRDQMTGLIPLSITKDGKRATREELETAPRGSVVVVSGTNWPTLLCSLHGEWVDLYSGIEETWKTASLLKHHEDVRLLWVAPGTPTPKPVRQDYDIHDEVLVDGRTAFIIGGGQGAYGVRFADGTKAARHGVNVSDIEYVKTPERPLTKEDASARSLVGWNIRCNMCGNHGASWVRGERPGWGDLALCPDHAEEFHTEYGRHAAEMKRLRTVNFEQLSESASAAGMSLG